MGESTASAFPCFQTWSAQQQNGPMDDSPAVPDLDDLTLVHTALLVVREHVRA